MDHVDANAMSTLYYKRHSWKKEKTSSGWQVTCRNYRSSKVKTVKDSENIGIEHKVIKKKRINMNPEPMPSAAPRFNSTNLYATTTQIIIKSNPKDPKSWEDLYRLMPYLRNSLLCVVCLELVVDPLTPNIAQCQHHLCRVCLGKRKQLKPPCKECRNCNDYKENKRLRMLLQCYKKMCEALIKSPLFNSIKIQASQPGTEYEGSARYIMLLAEEGASFKDDDYKRNKEQTQSANS